MTMIASVVTHDYVVQVSDRRSTDLLTRQMIRDDIPKTTVFNGSMLFGCTGLGILGPQRELTHRLVSRKLTESLEAPPGAHFRWFAAELTTILSQTPIHPTVDSKIASRLAVVGVGYIRRSADNPLEPVYVCLSNFRGPDGKWLGEALPAIGVFVERLPSARSHRLYTAGTDFQRKEQRDVERLINRAVARSKGPSAIVRILVDAIRAANRPGVSRSLIVSSLPFKAIPAAVTMRLGPPDFNEPTFLFIPDGEHDGTWWGPNVSVKHMTFAEPMTLAGAEDPFL